MGAFNGLERKVNASAFNLLEDLVLSILCTPEVSKENVLVLKEMCRRRLEEAG